jgi:RNA polymerase sigma-70 factor, ECF subfamily
MSNLVEAVWRRFSSDIRNYIFSRVKDEDLADDLLQEVFVKIHTSISGLRDETRIQSWIFQITRNVITDHFRRQTKNREFPVETALENESPDEVMLEAVEDMIRMMDNLPAEYCQALCLTEIEGLSQKEYADRAGISYTAAKSRVQRARKMLRDMLMKCCHYQFDKYGTVIAIYPAGCCCCPEAKN